MTTRNKLLSYGFSSMNDLGIPYLAKVISEVGDQFHTQLKWYEQYPNIVYIDRFFYREVRSVHEREVIENHLDLNTSAKNNWLAFKKEFPAIKSFY